MTQDGILKFIIAASAIITPGILITYISYQQARLKDVETLLKLIDVEKMSNLNNLQKEYALLLVEQRVDKFKREFKKNVTPMIKEQVDKLAEEFREQFDEMANVVYDDVIMTREKGDRRELIETYLPTCKNIFIPMLEKENEI